MSKFFKKLKKKVTLKGSLLLLLLFTMYGFGFFKALLNYNWQIKIIYPALGRQRQQDYEFETSLGQTLSQYVYYICHVWFFCFIFIFFLFWEKVAQACFEFTVQSRLALTLWPFSSLSLPKRCYYGPGQNNVLIYVHIVTNRLIRQPSSFLLFFCVVGPFKRSIIVPGSGGARL